MAGRKPKPTELKVFEGNRGHRPIPKDNPEPKLLDEFPPAPEGLNKHGKAMWEEEGRQLYELGVLKSWDLKSFKSLCKIYSKFEIATEWRVEIAYYIQYRLACNEFGLNPSARAKLHTSKPKKDDSKFGRFIK